MQDDRAPKALGLSHRIEDNVVARPDDLHADGKMRSPDFAERDRSPFSNVGCRQVDRPLHRFHRRLVAERLTQVHELDRIRPEGDEHLEVRGRTDGLGHLEGQAICLSVVISSGDGRFCVRAVRQQHRRAARPFEELRRLDPFEARAQMDVIVEDGHAIAERRWSLRLSRFRADSKTTRRRGLEGRGSSPRNLGEHLDSGFGLARERADRGTAPFE